MKITQVDVLDLRNRRATSKEKSTQDTASVMKVGAGRSIFLRVTAKVGDRTYMGLGESRPSEFSRETPDEAFKFGRRLAKELTGREFDFEALASNAVEEAHHAVQSAINSTLGVTEETLLTQRPSPSVCFAAECALLDIVAKSQGISVTKLVAGNEQEPIVRNVFNEHLSTAGKLLSGAADGRELKGWIRQGARLGAKEASALINSLLFSLDGDQQQIEGIIINAGQRWQLEEWKNFCDGLSVIGLVRRTGVKIVVEDPFPEFSDAFYREALAHAAGTDIRMILAKPVWGSQSISAIAEYLPHVDLKLTPQKAGGFREVLETERLALKHGFKGGVFLGNPPTTTNFNTLAMLALANALQCCSWFPATFKNEKKRRLIYPRAERVDNRIVAPEGFGWATNLCRSSLTTRLESLAAYGLEGRIPTRRALSSLKEAALDDRFIEKGTAQDDAFAVDDKAFAAALTRK